VTAPIIPGAEPFTAEGGRHGALVLHGFTGNPHSMKGIARALAAAGFAVECPLFPGHGTAVEDMIPTGWADWSSAAEETLGKLAARVEADGRIVVVGLSMGGALTSWLAANHPELAGIVCINSLAKIPDGMRELVEGMLADGEELMDGIGSDIADPDSKELSYPKTPLRPLLTLLDAGAALIGQLSQIRCPVLIITSRDDHVVEPSNSDALAEAVSGPVERLWFDRSYHVITLDYDKAEVEAAVVDFAKRVTAA
jgi:carboxylesterase